MKISMIMRKGIWYEEEIAEDYGDVLTIRGNFVFVEVLNGLVAFIY